MGLLEKGLLLLPCLGTNRAKLVRQQSDCFHHTPWHQQPDIVSLVLARLPTADVLSKERVCRAWRQARVSLTSDLSIVTGRKVCKSQLAWLRHNVDRIGGRLNIVEETPTNSKSHSSRSQQTTKCAYDIILLALQASQAQSLSLCNCSCITTLPVNSFSQLCLLQQLDISNCSNLVALPESLGSLVSLKQMTITSCSHLSTLPRSAGQLTALQQLVISNCDELQYIPESFGGLRSLEQLVLHSCMQLHDLPDSFGSLVALRQLDIQGCGLKALPGGVGRLSALKTLKVAHCPNLQELPESCSQLQQLQQLDLRLPLRYLPSISQLAALRRLHIAYVTDEVTSLTQHIGQLKQLESLTLVGWSGLQLLPEALCDLESLTQLGLKDCGQLMSLPRPLGRLRSLKRLTLQGCGLIALPPTLGDMQSLESLIIHSCDLRDLPNSIGQLTALQQFLLVDCPRLRHIPCSFGDLGRHRQQSSEGFSSDSDGSSNSSSPKLCITISGCEHVEMPVSMGHMRRYITPGRLAAAVAKQAMHDSW